MYRLDVQVINFFNTCFCCLLSFNPSMLTFIWEVHVISQRKEGEEEAKEEEKRLKNIWSPGFP